MAGGLGFKVWGLWLGFGVWGLGFRHIFTLLLPLTLIPAAPQELMQPPVMRTFAAPEDDV